MLISDLVPSVEMMVPDAEPLQLQEAVRNAVVRFMSDSQVFTGFWTVPQQPGITEYLIDLPECRRLVGIVAVTRNGREIDGWYRDDHEDVICFDQYPGDACLEVKYSWKVGRDNCEVPDKLYEDYLEPVRFAAIAELHKIFGSEMVSVTSAARAESQYQEALADVKGRKVFGFAHRLPRMHRGPRRKRGLWS